MKAKHQRLVLAVLALSAMIGAGFLAAFALQDQASYFYTPSDLNTKKPDVGRPIRLGGMVVPGSIKRADDGVTIFFTVQDKGAERAVRYKGITPDLFVEGSGVVADGALDAQGIFVAENLLAKHDENYVPRELQELDQHQAQKTGATVTP